MIYDIIILQGIADLAQNWQYRRASGITGYRARSSSASPSAEGRGNEIDERTGSINIARHGTICYSVRRPESNELNKTRKWLLLKNNIFAANK